MVQCVSAVAVPFRASGVVKKCIINIKAREQKTQKEQNSTSSSSEFSAGELSDATKFPVLARFGIIGSSESADSNVIVWGRDSPSAVVVKGVL